MKQIQPVSIWYNGTQYQATIFSLQSIEDNLSTYAVFFYKLFTNDNIQLTQGKITMDGFDYEAYSSSPDSNAYAYTWAAGKLNLTLV